MPEGEQHRRPMTDCPASRQIAAPAAHGSSGPNVLRPNPASTASSVQPASAVTLRESCRTVVMPRPRSIRGFRRPPAARQPLSSVAKGCSSVLVDHPVMPRFVRSILPMRGCTPVLTCQFDSVCSTQAHKGPNHLQPLPSVRPATARLVSSVHTHEAPRAGAVGQRGPLTSDYAGRGPTRSRGAGRRRGPGAPAG
jgi:hypothetical protein